MMYDYTPGSDEHGLSPSFPHCRNLGDRKMLQEAWGLVHGVRVLLVEAESKFVELKCRGARAGGVSDGMRMTCSACRSSARTPTGI